MKNLLSDRTIKIDVTIKNGAVIFPDEFNTSALRKEFFAEIILSETNFENKEVFNQLAQETEVEFFPAGKHLLVNVSTKERIKRDLEAKIIQTGKDTPQGKYGGFIEIILDAPQIITLRGAKKGRLKDCPIYIPALLDNSAKSINHAYKIIVQKFEPWRRSTTANVFQKVFYHNEETGRWHPLEFRRGQLESENKKPKENK